ncbi:P-loop containing nucleoside triphosphate hydrolase protein [Aspergillus insuetus]
MKITKQNPSEKLRPAFPKSLAACFELTVFDEAQQLRNVDSSQHTTSKDFHALQKFILEDGVDDSYKRHNKPHTWNPFLTECEDPAQELCLTEKALDAFLWKNPKMNPLVTGKFLANWLGNDIPTAQSITVEVHYTVDEAAQYKQYWRQLSPKLFIKLPETTHIVWNMKRFRELTLVTSWLWYRYCHNLVRAKAISQRLNEYDPLEMPSDSDFANPRKQLAWLITGAPKLRALLNNLKYDVHVHGEKSVVWCSSPGQQVLIAATLSLCRITYAVNHADLTQCERDRMAQDFTTTPNGCMVLICSYYVNAAGSNLQPLCCNSHHFDIPTSESLLKQAIGRLNRCGQRRVVKIYKYIVSNSFNMLILGRVFTKSLLDLAAMLNGDIFEMKVGQDEEGEITFDVGECGLKEDSDHIEEAEKAKWNVERDKVLEKAFDLIVQHSDEAWKYITPDMLPYIRDYVSEEFDLEADSGSMDIDERLEWRRTRCSGIGSERLKFE